jgi:hypothetical protein
MKGKLIFCFLLLILLGSCSDNVPLFSNGLVTGPDYRYCACCGGYFIEIDKTTYRFFNEELPEGSINFDLIDANFPIKVRVRWELKKDGCLGDEISIIEITSTN